MTRRPIAIALTMAFGIAISACSKSEAPAAEGVTHEAEHEHVSAYDGDAARGALIAVDKKLGTTGQSCTDCHGPGGAKPIDATYPILAGQYQDYLFHAIQQYRDGGREHALMTAQIKRAAESGKLDDQGIADLAAYYASQEGPLGDLDNR